MLIARNFLDASLFFLPNKVGASNSVMQNTTDLQKMKLYLPSSLCASFDPGFKFIGFLLLASLAF